jgi:voltage-gated potassium channel
MKRPPPPTSGAEAREAERVRGHLWRGAAVLLLVIGRGAWGYRRLMGWSLLQAVFFTLITITTIGYNDYQLTDSGKLFTIGVIVVGLAAWTFVLAHLVEWFVLSAAHWRRWQMARDLAELKGHYIVVGYGKVAADVARCLQRAQRAVLVVDLAPAAVDAARDGGLAALVGDATEEETLRRAGIERAAGLMAVTRSDPVNVFVTLTAKGLRPDLHVCAAAMGSGAREKLLRAGADAVVSPYEIGAQRLAAAALTPNVAELLAGYGYGDAGGLTLQEAVVPPGSPLCGQSLRQTRLRAESGVLVAALKSAGEEQLVISPSPDYVLAAGDVLIGLGLQANMARFLELVGPQ